MKVKFHTETKITIKNVRAKKNQTMQKDSLIARLKQTAHIPDVYNGDIWQCQPKACTEEASAASAGSVMPGALSIFCKFSVRLHSDT